MCIFRFMWAKGLDAKIIHKEMVPLYEKRCLFHIAVHNQIKEILRVTPRIHEKIQSMHPILIEREST